MNNSAYFQKTNNKYLALLIMLLGINISLFGIENYMDITITWIADDTLVPPVKHQNPANDDQYFFNFRLEHFAPETEPLIKEFCGTDLLFEEDAFWEYNSYNSHAVAFATNLPTITLIEYGTTTAYGQTAQQSDSYYYNHLHHLRDLQPATTYHYRIKMQDYDGNILISDDYAFTTLSFAPDIIRIPDDMQGNPPYMLRSGNAKYVLTQDITVPNGALVVKNNNIEIDLNGYTIIYDDSLPSVVGSGSGDYLYNDTATYGIKAGIWNFVNVKIFNGTIKQGTNGGTGFLGIGFNPVFLNHMGAGSWNEVAGIVANYYGESVSGMNIENGEAHHNIIIDRGTVVDDRHQGIKALMLGSDTNNVAAYNSIRRFRHQGIMGGGNKHHNELYSDSYATNSFLIGGSSNSCVEHNKLFGMGFNPVGIGWGSNMYINNNFIYLHGTAPSQRSDEYDRISGIAGVRLTLYGGYTVNNLVCEDNTIILKAWAGCNNARGIWTASGYENTGGVAYRKNTVKMELLSYDSINFNKVELALTAIDINGKSLPLDTIMPAPIIFEDNILIGNVSLITFGSSYSVGSNSHYYRTKLKRIFSYDNYFKPVRLGYYPYNTYNNKMIDTDLGVGIDIDPPIYHHLGTSAGYMEVSYGVLHELLMTDTCDNPIKNAGITISLNDSVHIFSTSTDENGKVDLEVLTVRHSCTGKIPERLEYTDYSFQMNDFQKYIITTEDLLHKEKIAFVGNKPCTTVAINNISNRFATLYCVNPAKEHIIIGGLQGDEQISVFDIVGRCLYSQISTSEKEYISTNNLSSGVYFVQVRYGEMTKTLKVMVTPKKNR